MNAVESEAQYPTPCDYGAETRTLTSDRHQVCTAFSNEMTIVVPSTDHIHSSCFTGSSKIPSSITCSCVGNPTVAQGALTVSATATRMLLVLMLQSTSLARAPSGSSTYACLQGHCAIHITLPASYGCFRQCLCPSVVWADSTVSSRNLFSFLCETGDWDLMAGKRFSWFCISWGCDCGITLWWLSSRSRSRSGPCCASSRHTRRFFQGKRMKSVKKLISV